MRMRIRRRAAQLALITLAAPIAAWMLEKAASRAEARDKASPSSRRLRQGADFMQRFGRGPLADRLRRRQAAK
jgi:hypothetical protein